jgi:hypothetical protein
VSGFGNKYTVRLLRRFISKRAPAAAIVVICASIWVAPALAYRPFDGTDAAVADLGEVEIEFQPIGTIRAGGTTKGLSDGIFNYGFADRWGACVAGNGAANARGGWSI